MAVRNPIAVRLLIGWAVVAALTLGGLALAGFLPPHPGFQTVFIPAVLAVLIQGAGAMMAARRGTARLGWLILLMPLGLALLLIGVVAALFAVGVS